MKNKKRIALVMGLLMSLSIPTAAVVFTATGCSPAETEIERQILNNSYYQENNGVEDSVTFSADGYTLSLSHQLLTGTYDYDETTNIVTLKVSEGETIEASFENGKLVFEYNGVNYSMLLKTYYTVDYNVDGGSAVSSSEVLNGKLLTQPTSPTKSGFTFVGWYEDSAFTKPFSFATSTITSNKSLYARFIQNSEADVYTITLDLGYDDATLDSIQTVNGSVYCLPEPSRTGYTFLGWWSSDYQSADKLTAKVKDGQTFKEDTTLYAVWSSTNSKDMTTSISVGSSSIEWTSIGVNKSYSITIKNSNGETVLQRTGTSLSCEFDFAKAEAGDYTIQIDVDGKTSYAYYKNRGLARVSIFSVEGNTLTFSKVENATSYVLSYTCGTEGHDHSNIVLGDQNTYDFSDCDMIKGGFQFTVKAEADGYMTSTSTAYAVERNLDAVTGLKVDAETDVVSWEAVTDATSYVIEVKKGEETLVKDNLGTATSYDLSKYYGDLSINVYPVAHGYNSPDATSQNYSKTRLCTPENVHASDGSLVWDAVEGAKGYEVTINGQTFTVDEASIPITDEYFAAGQLEFSVQIKAIAADSKNNSASNDPINVRRASMSDNVSYSNGVFAWETVIGIDKYGIKINDDEEIFVESDKTSFAVTFAKAGDNKISIRCYSENDVSDWVETTIKVYTFTLNTLGADEEMAPQYVVANDNYTFPAPTKKGYTFVGWFTSEENGVKQSDTIKVPGSDQTYYAHWKANTYKVTLSIPEGEGSFESGGVASEQEVTYDQSFTLPVPNCSNGARAFGGWYVGDVAYTDAEGVGKYSWNDVNDVTLTPKWIEAFTFTVSKTGDYLIVTKGEGISYLKTVTVPATYEVGGKTYKVGVIESLCFEKCNKLEVINIPNTIDTITLGDEGNNGTASAFKGCSSLREVNIYYGENNITYNYSSVNGSLLRYNDKSGAIELAFIPQMTSGKYVVPDGVTSIPIKVFKSCTSITEVDIPASVTYIGQYAFASCSKLTKVNFLAAATEGTVEQSLTIDQSAFQFCSAMTEITLPARLAYQEFTVDGVKVNQFTSIFEYCSALTKVNITEAANSDYSSIDGIVYTKGGKTLFYCPKGREEVTIGSLVTTIGNGAFSNCTKITKITIPGNVQEIEANAFYMCSGLENVTFEGRSNDPDLTIRTYAFTSCSKITSVVLPANLKTLETSAFYNCSYLTTVTVDCADENLNYAENAIVKSGNKYVVTTLILGPNAVAFDFGSVFGSALEKVEVDPANENYTDQDGVLFDKNITQILFYPSSKEGDYVLPTTVTTIGGSVFANKLGITKITIGPNVTTIGQKAFYGCTNLESLIFDNTGTEDLIIGDEAFRLCKALTSITLPQRLKTIGAFAFAQNSKLTSIVIPEGVTEIGHYAFYYDSLLTEVSLPSTLTKVGIFGQDLMFVKGTTTIDDGVICWYYNSSNKAGMLIYGTSYSSSSTVVSETNGSADIFENCLSLATVTVSKDNTTFAARDNVLYEKDEEGNLSVLLVSPRANAGVDGLITIPSTVTRVAERAFYGSSVITEVIFDDNDNELEIGAEAFGSAKSLTKVTLPNGLKTIAEGLFKTTGKSYLEEIIIPNTVTSIGAGAFKGNTALTTVTFEKDGTDALVFEDSAKSTSDAYGTTDYGAFAGCTALRTIVLPERTTKIGAYTFVGLTNLQSVTLPKSLTSIGNYAFRECKSLTVTFTNGGTNDLTINEGAFYQAGNNLTTGYDLSLPDNLVSIGKNAFYQNKIVNLSIPAKVTEIGEGAFSSVSTLQQVTFATGSQLETLGKTAFSACKELTTINLEACTKLTSIGDGAFTNDIKLNNVKIPDTVTSIGSTAFSTCSGLTTLTFLTRSVEGVQKSDLASIGASAFISSGLTELTFPDSTADEITLGDTMFQKCKALKTVNLSNSVKDIGGAFKQCMCIETITIPKTNTSMKADKDARLILSLDTDGNATTIKYAYAPATTDEAGTYTIPNGINAIASGAFYGQNGIKKLVIPASVREIESEAFQFCRGLQTIAFDNENSTLTTIGDKAFASCYSLSSLTLPDGLVKIGISAFAGDISLTTVTLPESLRYIGKEAFLECSALTSINIPAILSDDTAYTAEGMLGACTSLTTVRFSDELTWLPKAMFYSNIGCTSLKSVTLPASIKTIGAVAFEGCTALETVTILGKVEEFPDYGSSGHYSKLFLNCTSLETVILNDTIETLPSNLFEGCTSLKTVKTCDSTGAIVTGVEGEVNLPASLTNIGASTFQSTGIEKITIPYGVTFFGSNQGKTGITDVSSIFEDCTQLKTVILNDQITAITEYAFTGCINLKTIQYKDSDGKLYGKENEVTLPDTLTTLGQAAFGSKRIYNKTVDAYTGLPASGIEKITIPDSVNTYGIYLFIDCTSLKEVKLGRGITQTCASSVTSINLASTYANMFDSCTSLEKVIVTDALTAIGYGTFRNCTSLKTIQYTNASGEVKGDENVVTIPSSVTIIGNFAFGSSRNTSTTSTYSGSSIESVILPSTIAASKMGVGVFQDCTSLKTVTYAGTVYGNYMFDGCTSLETAIVRSTTSTFGTYTFRNCSSLTTMQLCDENGTLLTGDTAGKVGEITLPTGMNNLGTSATTATNTFYGCSSMTVLNLGSVTKIAKEVFSGCSSLTTVNDAENLTIVGNNAFYGCSNLQSIDLSKATTLGSNSFQNCSSLTSATLKSSITAIPASMFSGCSKLTTVKMGTSGADGEVTLTGVKTVNANAFENCTSLTKVSLPAVTSLGASAFSGCVLLNDVTMNTALTGISDSAFKNCEALTTITLPTSLTSIGQYAFSSSGLTEIDLPANLTSIGLEAFFSTGLTSITIPAKVTSIGGNAFGGCKLTEINASGSYAVLESALYNSETGEITYVSNTVTAEEVEIPENSYVGAYALNGRGNIEKIIVTPEQLVANSLFYYSGEVELKVNNASDASESATTIAEKAFRNYKGTSIVIPEGITAIGANAFENCTNLESIVLPSTLKTIGASAFLNCSSLVSIVIPDGVTVLNGNTFSGCTKLESVTLPSKLEKTGTKEFNDCTSLTSITLPETLTSAGTYNFAGCTSLKEVTIYSTLETTTASNYMFQNCTSIEKVTFGDKVTLLPSYMFDGCTSIKSVVIPDSVLKIYSYAFRGCTALESVKFGNKIDTIQTYAFANSGITSAVLPDTLTTLGTYAFANCEALQTVNIGNGLTSIGNYTFSNCTALASITLSNVLETIGTYAFQNCTALKSIQLPEGLTKIDKGAFTASGLTSITLPGTITSWGESCFAECLSLETVVFNDGITKLGSKMFDSCTKLKNVTLPSTLSGFVNAFINCTGIKELVIPVNASSGTWNVGSFSGWTADQKIVIQIYKMYYQSLTHYRAFEGCSAKVEVEIVEED